jgi:hypothetical protein
MEVTSVWLPILFGAKCAIHKYFAIFGTNLLTRSRLPDSVRVDTSGSAAVVGGGGMNQTASGDVVYVDTA